MSNILGALGLAFIYLIIQIILIILKKDGRWRDLITAAYWALISLWWICNGLFIEPNNIIVLIGALALFFDFLIFFILYISAMKDIEFLKERFDH